MPNTVILSAARTPVGKLGGGLSSLPATKLGAIAIEAALERAGVEPDQVQHVVMGQVLQAGQGQIPSRQAQIEAGIPKEVTSETINKVCASGVRAAGILDSAIRAGDLEVAVAGGMESMSNAPYLLPRPASACGWATPRCSTRWSRTGSATRSAGSRCSRRRPRSATSSR